MCAHTHTHTYTHNTRTQAFLSKTPLQTYNNIRTRLRTRLRTLCTLRAAASPLVLRLSLVLVAASTLGSKLATGVPLLSFCKLKEK